jgi:hypothetical protein
MALAVGLNTVFMVFGARFACRAADHVLQFF